MKILVAISQTPETTARVAFTDGGKVFDTQGVNFIMNPYDEWYALVRALELKEEKGGTVTVLHCGPAANDVTIRKALAIGADDAIRVDIEPEGPEVIARQIAAQVEANGYEIVFTGKETIDYNDALVGGMTAALLDWPFISHASHLEMKDDHAMVTRDIEGGTEKIEVRLPFVLSASKGLAEQRIPNMRGIMTAKTKPLQVVAPVDAVVNTRAVEFRTPEAKSAVKLVDPNDMNELVRLLHEEAKVI